jgi:hypothetical protein
MVMTGGCEKVAFKIDMRAGRRMNGECFCRLFICRNRNMARSRRRNRPFAGRLSDIFDDLLARALARSGCLPQP